MKQLLLHLRSPLCEGGNSKGQGNVKGVTAYLPLLKVGKKVAWLRSRQGQKRNSDRTNYIKQEASKLQCCKSNISYVVGDFELNEFTEAYRERVWQLSQAVQRRGHASLSQVSQVIFVLSL